MAEASGRFRLVRHLTVGAEFTADLSQPLTPDERAELRDLFLTHGLLYFPDQSMSLARQADVLASIGPVLQRYDGMSYVSTDEKKGTLGRSELIFHSDLDFSASPVTALALLATDVVPLATSTRFASNRGALARLPADLVAELRGLSLLTALPSDYGTPLDGAEIGADVPQIVRSPFVPHPLSGEPTLMVSQQAVRFEGVPAERSQSLLDQIRTWLYAPDNIYEHHWRNGDFVIWDNCALQHARGPITCDGQRTLQRVAVAELSFYDLVDWPEPQRPLVEPLNAAT